MDFTLMYHSFNSHSIGLRQSIFIISKGITRLRNMNVQPKGHVFYTPNLICNEIKGNRSIQYLS